MTINKELEEAFLKNTIGKHPLTKYINNISSDGFLIVTSNKNRGTLFFKEGKLITGEIDSSFSMKIASKIIALNKGTFFFQKWINKFKIDIKYINELFYFIELLNYNAKVKIGDFEFLFSEGAIVDVNPEIQNSYEIIQIIKSIPKEAKLTIEKTTINNGDLKLYFSEINTNQVNKNETKKNTIHLKEIEKKAISKKNNNILANPFLSEINNVQKNFDLKIAALNIYSVINQSNIYNKGFNKKQINQLIKFENNFIINNKAINKQMFINMNTHSLFSIFLKDFKIFFMFEKNEFNMGIMFNIMLPTIYKINDKINNINN